MKDSKRTVLHSPDSMTQSRLNPGLDFHREGRRSEQDPAGG
jgi:hypothetical protein